MNRKNAEMNKEATDAKLAWARPQLRRLEAGAAESNETGANFDISNPQRS